MVGVVIYLFFATAIGIFLGTVARSMPQLGLLYMLVYLPMNMLSGSNTPLESMPPWLATIMQISPSTHFVSFAQSILYRGAGLDVVWPRIPRGRGDRRRVLRPRHPALPIDRVTGELRTIRRSSSTGSEIYLVNRLLRNPSIVSDTPDGPEIIPTRSCRAACEVTS